MINRMSVPICNRFHTIRANNGKMTSLWHPRNDLYCVGWNVKSYSFTHSLR